MCKNDIFSENVLSLGFYRNNSLLYFDNLIDFYLTENLKFDNYCDICDYTIKRIIENLNKIDNLFGKKIRIESSKAEYIDRMGI